MTKWPDPLPIDDVLDHVLTDHTWLAADTVLAPVPSTPGRPSSAFSLLLLLDEPSTTSALR